MSPRTRPPIAKTTVGIGLFLASETVFFVLLAVAYVVYRNTGPWPASQRPLDALSMGLFTLALLASSLTWWLAERSARQGTQRAQRGWMALTLVLGATFMVGQTREYLGLIRQHITVSEAGVFGASFFTLTGFHGLHVLVGVILIAVLSGLVWSQKTPWLPAEALAAVGWYWHFVDGVWVVIYSLVYLWR